MSKIQILEYSSLINYFIIMVLHAQNVIFQWCHCFINTDPQKYSTKAKILTFYIILLLFL